MDDTGTPGVDAAQPTIAPEEIDQIFDSADLQAAVAQLAVSVDRQRKELVLLWVSLFLISGLLTYQFATELLGDA